MYLSPRMADSLVWLGRYQQRLETLGKETLICFDEVIDKRHSAGVELFAKLGVNLEYPCASEFLYQACYGNHPTSLLELSRQARENAIVIRDLLSDSLFGSVNGVYHGLLGQSDNHRLDAYQLDQLLTEIEYFWGRLSTRLLKSRASQFILLGQMIELMDLKLRLYGRVDSLLEDSQQLNQLGRSLSDNWQDMEPLRQTTEQSLTELAHKTAGVIVYDHV
jgi:uncharacterized alpha-E superfamily protein